MPSEKGHEGATSLGHLSPKYFMRLTVQHRKMELSHVHRVLRKVKLTHFLGH